MIRTTVKIDGMMCGMCEAHVCDAIRNALPYAKKVSASRSKGEATFLSEETPDEQAIRYAIAATGYNCLSVSSEEYVKKGLFSFR